jgi:hypothetical protein
VVVQIVIDKFIRTCTWWVLLSLSIALALKLVSERDATTSAEDAPRHWRIFSDAPDGFRALSPPKTPQSLFPIPLQVDFGN